MIFKSPLCIYDSADYQGDSCTNRRSRNVPGTGRCTESYECIEERTKRISGRILWKKAIFVNVPGDELLSQGHGPHTDLVQKEAAGEDAKMSLILAHAEDQMMSTEVFKVLAEEMIELYKKVNK